MYFNEHNPPHFHAVKDALAQNWEMIKETGEFNTIEPLK